MADRGKGPQLLPQSRLASQLLDLSADDVYVDIANAWSPVPEIYHDVKAEDAPRVVERMLKAYLAHRTPPQESFQAFTRRHDIDALRALADSEAAQ